SSLRGPTTFFFLFSFFYFYADHRDLHSFPTRRSSDLTIKFAALDLMLSRSFIFATPITREQRIQRFPIPCFTADNPHRVSHGPFCLYARQREYDFRGHTHRGHHHPATG